MSIFKRVVAAASVGLTVLIAGVVIAPAANAAPVCNSGYSCLYTSTNFAGSVWKVSLNQGTLQGLFMDNNAESATANGASCALTSFYTSADRTFSASQPYFFLSSYQLYTGEAWSDANLNGVDEIGYAQASSVYNYDFRNKVSSWKYSSCR